MSALFSPWTRRGLTVANRIVVSPMCQYSADDGHANNWHRVHLASLATSGAGLLFLEATAVTEDGRITPGCLGLWSDAHEATLGELLRELRAVTPPIKWGIQLAHAGRKASCNTPWAGGRQLVSGSGDWQTVAPSAVGHYPEDRAPRAMTQADLDAVREAFVAAALRSVRIGIEAIELHCAHGYLLHQFVSPIANQRDDIYGGSLENRMRYPLEIFDAVRAALPENIALGMRLSCSDGLEHLNTPSWTLEDSLAISARLARRGCDWIDASSGGVSPDQRFQLEPGYQVRYAADIREHSGVPTIAVGLITDPHHAERIVACGQADLVALARGMLFNPRWGWHAAAALGGTVPVPRQYRRAAPQSVGAIFTHPD